MAHKLRSKSLIYKSGAKFVNSAEEVAVVARVVAGSVKGEREIIKRERDLTERG